MMPKTSFQPRRGDRLELGLSPLRGWEYISPPIPVVTLGLHQANFRCASGAKICVETLACVSAHTI
jgi:hypothetical protein